MINYQINIIQSDADMNTVRQVCADLLTAEQPPVNAIYVAPIHVGEAVRRINEAGYSTDEDEQEEED